MRSCPEFERTLMRSGILLIKYWFSVSDEAQERRFQACLNDPIRRPHPRAYYPGSGEQQHELHTPIDA